MALFSTQARHETRRAMRRVTADAGEEMTRAAAAATPRDTGRTAERWRPLPVEPVPGGYQSGTENPDYRARFLEYGTDPHPLAPDDAEALDTPDGPRAGANHPGTRGHHMTATAAAEVDANLDRIAEPALIKWAAAVERLAD